MGSKRNGLLITIEGIDGVGKTTQVRLLGEFLRGKGHEVLILKEPTDGYWGKKIREISKKGRTISPKEECQWFLKDRMDDVRENINPALGSGKIVVMDRYYYSNMAYQGALGLDMDSIKKKNEEFSPRPDLVMILDARPKTGLDRIVNHRKEELNTFENLEYQNKVRENFLKMKGFENVRIIDARGNIKEVQAEIRRIVLKFLNL